jgi:hypothetical protein
VVVEQDGTQRIKPRDQNVIRWRKAADGTVESNARFVKW